MMDWLTNHTGAGLTGLLFFFLVFIGIAVWAYRPQVKERLESYKNIPLEGDEA
ncbi:MAG: cbb3-type cytochrome c oxidase subunit 3 [Alphaproteobacteria bacterium]|nr:MAG: cbb3-type cytochrome c oxidase subunit 3 [Alphaproteobacteria bacterium]